MWPLFFFALKYVWKYINDISKERESNNYPCYLTFWPCSKIEKNFENIGIEDKEIYIYKWQSNITDQKNEKRIFIKITLFKFFFTWHLRKSKYRSEKCKGKTYPIAVHISRNTIFEIKKCMYSKNSNTSQESKSSSNNRGYK